MKFSLSEIIVFPLSFYFFWKLRLQKIGQKLLKIWEKLLPMAVDCCHDTISCVCFVCMFTMYVCVCYILFLTPHRVQKVHLFRVWKCLIMSSSMKIVSLNARGLANKNKRQQVLRWLASKNSKVIFLQETHSTIDTELFWRSEWSGNL